MGPLEALEVRREALALDDQLVGLLGVHVVEHAQRLGIRHRLAPLTEPVAEVVGLRRDVVEELLLGHRLREGCKALPDPAPMSMFDHVYAEETAELAAQREGFAAYLESFEGAH